VAAPAMYGEHHAQIVPIDGTSLGHGLHICTF
jgi:hypothetical protein